MIAASGTASANPVIDARLALSARTRYNTPGRERPLLWPVLPCPPMAGFEVSTEAWASIDFPAWNHLLKYRKRIWRLTIGTHFYQTHPEVIERLAGDARIHFVQQTDGVFHPKVYLFENGPQDWACICGSANFTKSAMSTNSEACLLIDQGDAPEVLRRQVVELIDEAWGRGAVPTAEYIKYYRKQWQLKQARLKELAGSENGGNGDGTPKSKVGLPLHDIALVRMTWPHFMGAVKKEDNGNALMDRLNVLDAAESIFSRHERFADIAPLDRKRIAGAVGASEDGLEWK